MEGSVNFLSWQLLFFLSILCTVFDTTKFSPFSNGYVQAVERELSRERKNI
jgi:hypothetical protein